MTCCYDCGQRYGSDGWIEAIIPDIIWNKIKPSECEDDCGILCISCIARRLKIAKINNIPVWMCGTENLIAHAGDPGDELELVRNFEHDK